MPNRTDRCCVLAWRTMALVSAGIVVSIIVYLAIEAVPGLRAIELHRFVTDAGWDPAPEIAVAEFGAIPLLVGSLATSCGAVLLAAPISVLGAVFCHCYATPRIRACYRTLIWLLAGIPSVVFGLWGLETIAPVVRRIEPPGTSLLTGVLVLALMIAPTIAMLSDACMSSVPRAQLQGAAALGFSRVTTLRGVVLPHARVGLVVAVILGATRAIGETMAVLMVCGNIAQVPDSPFDAVRTLTTNIALELGYATSQHRAILFVTALALMLLVIGIVFGASLLQRPRRD